MSSESSGNENEKDYSNFSMTQTSLHQRKKAKFLTFFLFSSYLYFLVSGILKSIPDQRKSNQRMLMLLFISL